MKRIKFDFSRARRVTLAEHRMFRNAFENTFGIKPPDRGRPPKGKLKYQGIYIRIHPKAIQWARAQAKKSGKGYQTVINETLLRHAA